ncbi:MAG: LPS-assembly protein LptD [Ancalomicrobiaceae bacterium]|nr:LPS-assembly protein LptD [Ancalomicrobiaceae bacterium]
MARHVTRRDGTEAWCHDAPRMSLCARTITSFIGVDIGSLGRRVGPAALAIALLLATATGPALAQSAAQPPAAAQATPAALQDNMLAEADQSIYDKDHETVTLIGKVQIYYKRHTLQADKVTYYTKTKRVVAEGSVRLTEPGGNLLKADKLDVTQGFEQGFVQSLKVESIDRSEFDATSAQRQAGNVTVFENGVYNACQSCENEPTKPPFWQIRAAKIIHNQQEKMVYYEDARLEFLGVPIAYVPYMQHPDPTVTRKTGFLRPSYAFSSNLGLGLSAPFFWAPTKDWDVTLQPVYLSRQGLLGDVTVRHRLEDGIVSFRAIGINQADPTAFSGTSGDRATRGAFYTKGEFDINEKWKWGWTGVLLSDRRFASDYHFASADQLEATSQLFLTGQGQRTFFDAHVYAFQVYGDDDTSKARNVGNDLQNKQPFVATADYDVVFDKPVLDGELSAKFNATNVFRKTSDFDVAGQTYGIAGNFTRVSAELNWRRQITDDFGQVFVPFASLRTDLFFNNKTSDAGTNWSATGGPSTDPTVGWQSDTTAVRAMPAIGLEYHYPWLFASSFGNSIIEPIAQVVARPNETDIGKLPNEDAQSIVFDDTTLFQTDKFSGFDRAEGGTRANLGLQYTFLAPNGVSINALFGQSYQLAGVNSFSQLQLGALEALAAAGEAVPLSAIGSGLGTNTSDYVARFNLDSGFGLRFGTSARFDEKTFELRRTDISLVGVVGPLTAGVNWDYLKTPQSVFDLLLATPGGAALLASDPNLLGSERSEMQGSIGLRLHENWRLFGRVRYDMRNQFLISDSAGIGYDNDSFSASLSFSEDTNLTQTQIVGNRVYSDRIVYFHFALRTLGDASISNSLMGSNQLQ